MSLIKGMDDVMTHIKNQGLRIKKLEEISNTLNSENDRLEEENEGYIKRYCEEECEIAKLKKENEGLKKEHDRMSAYMYPREIKYCEKCMKYGDEDEIVQDEEDECSYICHDCCNEGDKEFKMFVKRYHEMAATFMGLNK